MVVSVRRAGVRAGGWALATTLLVAGRASGEELFGNAQVQFQRVQSLIASPLPDGSSVLRRQWRELWIQSYDLNDRAYPRENLLVQTTLRLSQLSYGRGSDFSQTPQGSIRIIHPWMNLFASHQPSTSRTTLIPFGESTGSPSGTTLTTKTRETQLVGHFARPTWPQLDLSWLRRTKDALDQQPGEKNQQNSARLSYTRDRWSTYGSVVNQRFERGTGVTTPLRQRVAAAGGAFHLAPLPHTAFSLQYDLADTRSGFVGQRDATSRTHSIETQADWRPRPQWDYAVNGTWHRIESNQIASGGQTDWEGNATASWLPSSHARVSGAGGVRRVHLVNGDADVRYTSLVAAGDARVRRDWQANAMASATENWDPERGTYPVGVVGGSTRYDPTRRVHLDGNYQFTANGDTAAASQRYSVTWSTRLNLIPLRSFQIGLSLGSFRVGSGILHPTGVSRTGGVDVKWQPVPMMDVTGSYATSGLLPNNAPRVVTRSVTARATPRPSIQLIGSWSSSSQQRTSTESASLTGRELVSTRAQVAFTRRVTGSGGISLANPGTSQESRLYDAVMTWSFGR